MDVSRSLAANEPNGTVIVADFQERGRGRQNRQWKTEKGQNLMFTIFLNYPDFATIPKALTLRTGLAAALAVEDFIPDLAGSVEIKWPNDLMIRHKKTAGILVETTTVESATAENNGVNVFIGIGVNLLQQEFPEDLRGKAGSLLSIYKDKFTHNEIPAPFTAKETPLLLMGKILVFLHAELVATKSQWKAELEKRLYKRGETVSFAEGAADSQKIIRGCIAGIGEGGELLLIPDGETEPKPFINGELRVY
jgi:BirA family biotin operon repressor/biotin-[acetyl-CoA-carboxylase] ligase